MELNTQGPGSTPASDPRTNLLVELIAYAYRTEGVQLPTVVQVTGSDGSDLLLRDDWPVINVDDVESFIDRVTDAARRGPVLALPPWGYRSGGGPVRSFEQEILAAASPGTGGPIGILTPASTLTSSWSARFRESLVLNWAPVLVMTAREALASVHTSFEFAFVLLRSHQAGGRQPLRFFRVPPRANAASTLDEFTRLLKRQGGHSANGYVLRDLPGPGESLAYDRHDPRIRARAADLVNFGSTMALGDMFDVLQARPIRPQAASPSAESMREISGRDVQRDGTIAPRDSDSRQADRKSLVTLQGGDLLVRAIRHPSDPNGLVLAKVQSEDLPSGAGRHVLVLRPREPLTFPQERLLMMFAKSRLAITILNGAASNSMAITVAALRDLPIPQPDDALADALADLGDAANQLAAWHTQAERLIESVFDGDSASNARAGIIANGRNLRLRVDSARLLDDFDHSVRTRFPYPIAYRWRSLDALRSGLDHERTYLATLECFESLLCYAASVAMVMASNSAVSLNAVDGIRDKLASGRGGTTLGGWVSVLEEVANSRQFAALPVDLALGEIRGLLTADTLKLRKRLSERRNDQAHLRRLHPSQMESAADDAFQDLVTLMKRASVLMDLSLVQVTATKWDAFKRTTTVDYRLLAGDHSVVPYRQAEFPRNDIEAGSLYITDTNGDLHLARPYLVGRECPDCGMWSTFHLDRVEDGQPIVKSLEVGHSMPDNSQTEALRSVGLL